MNILTYLRNSCSYSLSLVRASRMAANRFHSFKTSLSFPSSMSLGKFLTKDKIYSLGLFASGAAVVLIWNRYFPKKVAEDAKAGELDQEGVEQLQGDLKKASEEIESNKTQIAEINQNLQTAIENKKNLEDALQEATQKLEQSGAEVERLTKELEKVGGENQTQIKKLQADFRKAEKKTEQDLTEVNKLKNELRTAQEGLASAEKKAAEWEKQRNAFADDYHKNLKSQHEAEVKGLETKLKELEETIEKAKKEVAEALASDKDIIEKQKARINFLDQILKQGRKENTQNLKDPSVSIKPEGQDGFNQSVLDLSQSSIGALESQLVKPFSKVDISSFNQVFAMIETLVPILRQQKLNNEFIALPFEDFPEVSISGLYSILNTAVHFKEGLSTLSPAQCAQIKLKYGEHKIPLAAIPLLLESVRMHSPACFENTDIQSEHSIFKQLPWEEAGFGSISEMPQKGQKIRLNKVLEISNFAQRKTEAMDLFASFHQVEGEKKSLQPKVEIGRSTLKGFEQLQPGDETKGIKYWLSLLWTKQAFELGHQGVLASSLERLGKYIETKPKGQPAQDWTSFFGQQAVKFIEGTFKADPYDCAENIQQALKALQDLEKTSDIRSCYGQFIVSSRHALLLGAKLTEEQRKPFQEDLEILKAIHHLKYTSVSMYPFYKDTIEQALLNPHTGDPFKPEELTIENVADQIHAANKKLSRKFLRAEFLQDWIAMNWKKLQGTVGLFFDPSRDSNTPWVHSTQTVVDKKGQEKTVLTLRHGTPTCDPGVFSFLYREGVNLVKEVGNWVPLWNWAVGTPSSGGCAAVVADYEAHLEADLVKQTLYNNHQEYEGDEEAQIHGEGDRSKALQGLEKNHPNFHFLALPMDGPLWKKERLDGTPLAQLKVDLTKWVMNEEHGFALPAAIKNASEDKKREFTDKIKFILGHIQEQYFGQDSRQNHAPLTREENTAFIMIFFSYLKNLLKSELEIDYVVSACKDNKDRGNASTLTDMAINMMLLEKEKDKEALEELYYSALGPFIIKNEKIIDERLEMGLEVIKTIAKLSEEQKQAIRKAFQERTGLQITGQSVPKELPDLRPKQQ